MIIFWIGIWKNWTKSLEPFARDFLNVDIFKFLENPLVPPTNNSSERGFRKLKVKNKISGTFRSDDGADVFFSLHSIVETAAKHEQPVLDALLAIF